MKSLYCRDIASSLSNGKSVSTRYFKRGNFRYELEFIWKV